MRPHGQQPTRLTYPWDSPGKITGVGCHFLLQCMKGKSESEVAQSCPTLSDLMDCSLPGSSVHGIFQARVLEWVAIAFSDVMTNIEQLSCVRYWWSYLILKTIQWRSSTIVCILQMRKSRYRNVKWVGSHSSLELVEPVFLVRPVKLPNSEPIILTTLIFYF